MLGTGYLNVFPTIIAGYITIAVSIILIVIGEGVHGLIELPAIFSNVTSYARLMALGVASAALAVVVNELAHSLFLQNSIIGYVLGSVILIIGHTINFLLGIFGAFVHSLRLHYIEFFSRFYSGGGKAYMPFGKYHD